MIGFGVFFLTVIMLVFYVTHMLKFDPERESVEVAGELCLVLLGGIACYLIVYIIRGLL